MSLHRSPLFALGLLWLGAGAHAQSPTPATPPSPTPPPAPAAAPAPAPQQQLDRIDIRGAQESDSAQRQRSTASKIIIGREEIERYGDSTVGELLRRLPGVTQQGAPGRGGRIAMRGLGNYTQILLDGQRVPPGFSIDSLNPEQIERIEILRAPTAETGARAIAGTINIVTREGFVKRLNDLVLSAGYEGDRWRPEVSWTRNDSVDRLIYNLSVSAGSNPFSQRDVTTTIDDDPRSGAISRVQQEVEQNTGQWDRVSASGRLQWRLDNGSLLLAPFLLNVKSSGQRQTWLDQPVGSVPPLYARSFTDRENEFRLARMNTQWRHRFESGASLETRLNFGEGRNEAVSSRREFDGAGGVLRSFDDASEVRNRSADLGSKLTLSAGKTQTIVGGLELEVAEREETRRTLQDGAPVATDFGDNLQARSQRLAAYAQNEWTINPQWAAHAGLRWEGIRTRGEGETQAPTNTSSVFSPLLHGVYKLTPGGRDQIRVSLTRSYRSPQLNDLIARPSISPRFPVAGPNTPTSPDRAGNPALKPELATGIDIAAERYLAGGGLFSANLFHRQISDLMRTLTTLESVSWSSQQRWVARPQNIGDATTTGLELEAKFRLNELWTDALPVDIRANASLFRSRVKTVPGPDNRLDQQPNFTANLGADYRIRRTPLMLGGSVNITPGYDTRLSESQSVEVSRKRVVDLYAQWTFNPSLRARLSVGNVGPLDYLTQSELLIDPTSRETVRSTSTTQVSYRLRVEMKL